MTVLTGIWQIVTSLSIVSQVFILAIATIWLLFNIRYTTRVVELGPTILTTLGIFGTFLGVAIGLSHFDTTNVQASVPSLLAGLKTAFWASVFGVGAAVQLKLRELMIGAFTKKKPTGQSVTPLAVLVDIREALAGYGDASLSQQIRMLRQEMGGRLVAEVVGARKEATERLDAIRQGQIDTLAQMELAGMVQQKALHKLADGATESLVAALQRVVTDFNDKVASQFGENYRELGDAVRQLLAWQEDYRETINATNQQLADTLRQLGYAAGDFRAVTAGSAHFAQTAERVALILDAIEAGENRLMVLARSMAKVTEDASGRIPFIEARIAELTSQMTRAVQDNQAAVHAALTGSAAELQRTITAMQAELSGVAQAGTAGVQENQRAIAAALQDNAASMAASLQAAQGALTAAISGFQAQMASMVEATAQRVVALDEHAASGLTQSVLHLVGNLTAQLEAASAGLADRAPRQRRVLHVVGEAGVAADQ
jgi:hypothetical protein